MPFFPAKKITLDRSVTPTTVTPIKVTPTAQSRLDQIERITHLMDESFTIPGTNFRLGWDSIIGLVPGVGDVVTSGLSVYLVYQAKQAGASKWLLTRMLGNIGIDFAIGAIPLLGDVFDTVWKANRKNTRLLKSYLERTKSV